MQPWLNFWIFLFWVCLSLFITSALSFLFLLLIAEIIWLVLYVLIIALGTHTDELTLLSLTFFLLGFASIEFSIGFIALIAISALQYEQNSAKNPSLPVTASYLKRFSLRAPIK